MALFQNGVIRKYLKALDQSLLNEKWLQFQNHFHNPTLLNNIPYDKLEKI